MAIPAADNHQICSGACDLGEKNLDCTTLLDNRIEGYACVDERAAPKIAHQLLGTGACTLVHGIHARFVLELRERRSEFDGMHSSEVSVVALSRRPNGSVEALGEAVDPHYDLAHQRPSLEQMHDRYHDDGNRTDRGNVICDATHRQSLESSAAPATHDNDARVQVVCGLQDPGGGMTRPNDLSFDARRRSDWLTFDRNMHSEQLGITLGREPRRPADRYRRVIRTVITDQNQVHRTSDPSTRPRHTPEQIHRYLAQDEAGGIEHRRGVRRDELDSGAELHNTLDDLVHGFIHGG